MSVQLAQKAPELAPSATPELDAAMHELAAISEGLMSSYRALADRAERVESELTVANERLEAKVLELDEVKRHLEAILSALPTGVVVRNANGSITRLNEVAEGLLANDRERVLARALDAGLDGPNSERLHRVHDAEDDRERFVASRVSTVYSADGRALGTVHVLDDRSETARLTERLHAADKMAALGTVAAGIAHEIRNPLNAVQGFAALLADGKANEEEQHRWSKRICTGASEMDAIVESVLSFSNPEKLSLETVDAEELAEQALTAAWPRNVDRSRFQVELEVEPARFAADRMKLKHALRNLIANALQMQPEGGALRIEIASGDAPDANGDEVVLSVADAGPGFHGEVRRRALDPFFTTRPEGSGLGLALVQTIARLHGGRVDIGDAPAPLGGAHVHIRIPKRPTPNPS